MDLATTGGYATPDGAAPELGLALLPGISLAAQQEVGVIESATARFPTRLPTVARTAKNSKQQPKTKRHSLMIGCLSVLGPRARGRKAS